MTAIQLSAKGTSRWQSLHPWIFASDCVIPHDTAPGVVQVKSHKGQVLGHAFFSPHSQITLRWLSSTEEPVTEALYRMRMERALLRRQTLTATTDAYRVVFGESDGLPSIIVDRYNDVAAVQTLSAGAETVKDTLFALIMELLPVQSLVERNDVPVRGLEQLPQVKRMVQGTKSATEIHDTTLTFLVDCMEGQKTGAFLDHRAARRRMAQLAKGRVLDCFSYEGWGACYMAGSAAEVVAVEVSEQACGRIRANVDRNGLKNVTIQAANVFDFLKSCDERDEKFDLIHLDPPAFIKSRKHLPTGIRGYKEINLRAMRCLNPGGVLVTSSCSHHLTPVIMQEMLRDAAMDTGRDFILREHVGQDIDHPILLNFPESQYLKGFVLEAR